MRKLKHYKHPDSKILAKEVLGKLAIEIGKAIFQKGEKSTVLKSEILKSRCK